MEEEKIDKITDDLYNRYGSDDYIHNFIRNIMERYISLSEAELLKRK